MIVYVLAKEKSTQYIKECVFKMQFALGYFVYTALILTN